MAVFRFRLGPLACLPLEVLDSSSLLGSGSSSGDVLSGSLGGYGTLDDALSNDGGGILIGGGAASLGRAVAASPGDDIEPAFDIRDREGGLATTGGFIGRGSILIGSS